VAVISTRNHEPNPLIDALLVEAEAGHLADVVVIPTGPLTYEMESLMAPGTHVFGGAGRVYPPGIEWEQNTRKSPLRFAYDEDAAGRAAQSLIEDAVASSYKPAGGVDIGSETVLVAVPDAEPQKYTPDTELAAALAENVALRRQLTELRERTTEQLTAARKKSGKVRDTAATFAYDPLLFVDAEDAIRYAVHTTWASRIPAGDKALLRVPGYDIGEDFAGSLDKLDESQIAKTFKCVVDVLTDLSRQMPARRVHPLRANVGPDSAVTRLDGAVCYRASLEAQTASARRLHYWKLPSGRIELSRVVTHDDMRP
jgi:hypothetical protein